MSRRKSLADFAAERQRYIPLIEKMSDMKKLDTLENRIEKAPCETDADRLAVLSILLEDSADFADHFTQRLFERLQRERHDTTTSTKAC
jgi:hypothetical protein